MAQTSAQQPSYLANNVTPEAMQAYFVASQRLFRVAPWLVVPDSQAIIAITSETLGLNNAVLSIVGPPLRNSVLVFANALDYANYLHTTSTPVDDTTLSRLPGWTATEFHHGKDIDRGQLLEIKQRDWAIAGPAAFPLPNVRRAGALPQAATPDDIRLLTVVQTALAELIGAEPRLGFTWEPGNPPITREISVPYAGGDMQLTLAAPHPDAGKIVAHLQAAAARDALAAKSSPSRAARPPADKAKEKAKRKAAKAARKKNR